MISNKSNTGNYMKAITVDLKNLVVLKSENAEFLEEASQVLLDYFLKKNGNATNSDLISFNHKKKLKKIQYDLEFLFKFQHLQYKIDTNVQNLTKLLRIRRDDCLLIQENNLKNSEFQNGHHKNNQFNKNILSKNTNGSNQDHKDGESNGCDTKHDRFKANQSKNNERKEKNFKKEKPDINQTKDEEYDQTRDDEFRENSSKNGDCKENCNKKDESNYSHTKNNIGKDNSSKNELEDDNFEKNKFQDTVESKVRNPGTNPFRISFDVRDL